MNYRLLLPQPPAVPTSALSQSLPRPSGHWIGQILIGLLGLVTVQAAVTEAWVQRYNNPLTNNLSDTATAIVRDPAGNVIVTGTSELQWPDSEMLTVKYSGTEGRVLWQKRYGASGRGYNAAVAVAVDAQGNVIVTGASQNEMGGWYIGLDIYTAKYAAANGTLLWEQRYNSPENTADTPTALALSPNGDVIVTGESASEFYTAKYAAANGALLWEHRYTGTNNGLGDDTAGIPSAVVVDANGDVVVTGESENGTDSDYYTAKYAGADGALIWERRYDGPIQFADVPEALAVDGGNNVVVTGSSYSTNGAAFPTADIYTVKYAGADGALLWQKRFSRPNDSGDVGRSIAIDSSDNVIVAGHVQQFPHGWKSDFYTVKYAAVDGTVLWEKIYNGPNDNADFAQAVAVDSSDDVVVTGVSASRGTPSTRLYFDYYTAKYAAADGALLWERCYNGPADEPDEASALSLDHNANVFVTGFSRNSLPGFDADFYTAKYASADGAVLWEKRHNSPSQLNLNDAANAIAVDHNGDVVVTGNSDNKTNPDIYTAKYVVSTGMLLWERRYNGGANGQDVGTAIAVDASGNVVVVGASFNGTNDDFYTAKYASTDGALLWERSYNGPANRGDYSPVVALDSSGNAVVLGSSENASDPDFYTAKYAAADGTLLWERRYNGSNRNDQPYGLAVDDLGNAIVTGLSYNSVREDDIDFYTAKYAAADGAVLWERRYNGPANSHDGAIAVAVDRYGNVAVTGRSHNTNRFDDSDVYTAKYAAADGAVLWEKRYNGPGNNFDQGQAVAIDASGNVVVTGVSSSAPSDGDYYTAKYAAADGALLWEKRYGGSGFYDYATALAVDEGGNVIVTGSSSRAVSGFDYFTIKYAGSDGTVLWEKRYNGPGNGEDYVNNSRSLALGPNGLVAITGFSGLSDSVGYHPDYLTIVYRESMSIDLTLTGPRISFNGTPGQSYNIERAPSVSGPWSTNSTVVASANGSIAYVDTNALSGSAFYRLRMP